MSMSNPLLWANHIQIKQTLIMTCVYGHLTCWFGAGEGKGRSTALLDLFIASVQVNAVHSERLQALNFSTRFIHLSLMKLTHKVFRG